MHNIFVDKLITNIIFKMNSDNDILATPEAQQRKRTIAGKSTVSLKRTNKTEYDNVCC